MPNAFAFLALFSWIFVVYFLFKRLPRDEALSWSLLGGYLALPHGVAVNLPVLPSVTKDFIPAVVSAVMVLSLGAEQVRSRRSKPVALPSAEPAAWRVLPMPLLFRGLLLLYVLTPLATTVANPDTLFYGPLIIPGLRLYDALSFVQSALVTVIPFLLGHRLLARPESQRSFLRILVLCAAIYTVPILYELRMSPQIARMTYGFLAQDFAQASRGGGYRPVVFLQHGLWLALFMALAALAAWTLLRGQIRGQAHPPVPAAEAPAEAEPGGARPAGQRLRGGSARGRGAGGRRAASGSAGRTFFFAAWITLILFLCKSFGAAGLFVLIMGIFFLPLRLQLIAASLLATMVLVYPMLRGSGLMPVSTIASISSSFSDERGQSFLFRLNNEDLLLQHANERPLLGWGGWGRALLYSPETGRSLTIPDGMWVIAMGLGGWTGYLATYGLLGLPIICVALRRRHLGLDKILPGSGANGLFTGALCLMLTLNLLDSISNATVTPITWLIAGALVGRLGLRPVEETVTASVRPLRGQRGRPSARRSALARAAAVLLVPFLLLHPQGAQAEALPDRVGLSDPPLAYGLAGISDWGAASPFLDLMKSARPFLAHSADTWSFMAHEQLVAEGYLDAEGWPLRLPPGASAIGTVWAWEDTSPAAPGRSGVYVLRHEGQGELQIRGDIEILSQSPRQIVFRNKRGGTMLLNITEIDPSDPLRAITLVRQEDVAIFDMGEIFDPDWLALIADSRVLRFMDWMQTNGTTSAHWQSRPHPGDATYAQAGVPVEVMVALANKLGAEPWFNMPMGADEDYIRNFATYVRDALTPGLVAHVEYSNETWNWMFPQTRWLDTEAKARWGGEDGGAWLDMQAQLATRAALIWDEVFGPEAATRLDNVLGTQTVNIGITTRLLEAPLWKASDPQGWVAPGSVFDSLAVTTYFGFSLLYDAPLRADLAARIQSDPQAAALWLDGLMRDPNREDSLPSVAAKWQETKDAIAPHGLKLIAYEGGQHLLQLLPPEGVPPGQEEILFPFLVDYLRGAHMADLYEELWDAWAAVGQGPFMQFGEVAPANKYGFWGIYDALDDTSPRAERLEHLNATRPTWFGSGGGEVYRQGVIRRADPAGGLLTGSRDDDLLVGGRGADRFEPGQGQDIVAGGGGRDVVILAEPRSAYRITRAGETVEISGAGLKLKMRDIALLAFPDPQAASGQVLVPLEEALAE
jgi:hypothetical protein